MLQKAKEYGFFLAVFVLVVYGISFLAPNTAGNPISLRELLAPYIPGALAILKTGLLTIAITVASLITGLLAIAFRDRLAYRMNQSIAKTASQHDKPIRVNVNGWHIQEKRVAESDSRLQAAIQERNEWQRKYHALLSSQRLAQASAGSPEATSGAQMLTYASVVALLQERPTSINKAQEIVRRGGGTVPRDYSPLREIVRLLHPSPTEVDAPIHEAKPTVNTVNDGKYARVNGATGRSQPRRGKGR